MDSALGGDKTFLPQTDVTKRIPSVQQYQQKPDRPNYGCQVTIQTEEEKRMMKLMRKEERRDRRRQVEEADDEQFSLDPETLREQRYCCYFKQLCTRSSHSCILLSCLHDAVRLRWQLLCPSRLQTLSRVTSVAGKLIPTFTMLWPKRERTRRTLEGAR